MKLLTKWLLGEARVSLDRAIVERDEAIARLEIAADFVRWIETHSSSPIDRGYAEQTLTTLRDRGYVA